MTVAGVQRTRLIVAVVLAVVAAAVIFAVIGAAGHDNRDAFADSRTPPDLAERFYPPENWAWGELQATGGRCSAMASPRPRSIPGPTS